MENEGGGKNNSLWPTDYWPTYLGGKETVRKHFYFSAAAQKTRKLTPAKKLKFGDIECFKQ